MGNSMRLQTPDGLSSTGALISWVMQMSNSSNYSNS